MLLRCLITQNPVGTDTLMIDAPECECQGCRASRRIEELEFALRKIRDMKSEPIGDTGFSVGKAQLLINCQRIARKALKKK